ncbi:GDSL-like Lipase/Acylhydrolase family protein [uncultured archaeon]|nr:GDSL-like Lipase/Acylhydrolase family protein [uncultured archaeon]
MGKDIKILVFGNSDAYGAWDFEGGWVERLRKTITKKVIETNQKFYCTLYNLSISGNTTGNLLKRFEFETKDRVDENEDVIIVFPIGANDTIVDRKGIVWTAPDKFAKNVEKLIKLAQKYAQQIIFISPMPVDEVRTNPVFWDADVSYSNLRLEKYNEMIKSACVKNNVLFVNIFEELIKSDYKNLLEDGVHPNTDGHKRIFEEVKKFLGENNVLPPL